MPENPVSPIAQINSQDVANYEQIRKALGPVAALPDDLFKLYEIHLEAITPFLHTQSQSTRVAAALHMVCRKHLALATNALFRLYASPGYRETRAAVETAGIAYTIQNDPSAFEIFRKDVAGNSAGRKRAKQRFRPGEIFPCSIPLFALLKQFYDDASERSHTNAMTFFQHFALGGKPLQQFSYQDFPQSEIQRDLPNAVIWTCQVHLCILMASKYTFSVIPGTALASFEKEGMYILQKLERFALKYQQMPLPTRITFTPVPI